MPTRHAWNDNNYEGKLLRKAISKLAKRLKDEEDMPTQELVMLVNCIAGAANAKKGLAAYEYQDKKIQQLEEYIESRKLKKYSQEYDKDALPG